MRLGSRLFVPDIISYILNPLSYSKYKCTLPVSIYMAEIRRNLALAKLRTTSGICKEILTCTLLPWELCVGSAYIFHWLRVLLHVRLVHLSYNRRVGSDHTWLLSEDGRSATCSSGNGAICCDSPFLECFLKRYHRTLAMARMNTVMPATAPPTIGPRAVRDSLEGVNRN